MIPAEDVVKQLKKVGFKVIEDYDMCEAARTVNGVMDIPWYEPLASKQVKSWRNTMYGLLRRPMVLTGNANVNFRPGFQ